MKEGFACRCGEENLSKMKDLMVWAEERLSTDFNAEIPFVSKAIMELHWSYGIQIQSLPVDQWFGIAYLPSIDNSEESGWVEADRVEEGLALILKKAYDKWGKNNPKWADDEDEDGK